MSRGPRHDWKLLEAEGSLRACWVCKRCGVYANPKTRARGGYDCKNPPRVSSRSVRPERGYVPATVQWRKLLSCNAELVRSIHES